MSDLISVIIPTYNYGKYIEEAIQSVLQQDYASLEILIVDDGSTDNTREIVKPYLSDNVRYFYRENNGHAAARNFGIREARGNYIAQLDADDYYLPHKLSLQMDYLRTHPQCPIVFTRFKNFYKNSEERAIVLKENPRFDEFVVNHTTMLARKDLFSKVGYYDEEYKALPDVFWMDRLGIEFEIPFSMLDEVLLIRRVHLSSISTSYKKKPVKELYMARCKLLRKSILRSKEKI